MRRTTEGPHRRASGYRGAILACALAALCWIPLGTATPPAAASCAGFGEFKPYDAADVVLDAVALSGVHGRFAFQGLLSPARFFVLRYRKGSGPRVVKIHTDTDWRALVARGGASEDDFVPRVGDEWRIYGKTPAGGHRARAGLRVPRCWGWKAIAGKGYLRGLARVHLPDPAGRGEWQARVLSAPRGARCLVLDSPAGGAIARTECVAKLSPKESIVSWPETEPDEGATSTGVAVAGRDLAAVTIVGSPDGRVEAKIIAGRLAVGVLSGYVPRRSLAVEIRHSDGTVERDDDAKQRTVVADGPKTGTYWTATTMRTPDPAAPRCAVLTIQESPFEGGACAARRAAPLYFRVSEALGETIVAGAAGPQVASITVSGPDGERQLVRAPRGGAFLTLYPSDVTAQELTLTALFSDGSREVYVGRSNANTAS